LPISNITDLSDEHLQTWIKLYNDRMCKNDYYKPLTIKILTNLIRLKKIDPERLLLVIEDRIPRALCRIERQMDNSDLVVDLCIGYGKESSGIELIDYALKSARFATVDSLVIWLLPSSIISSDVLGTYMFEIAQVRYEIVCKSKTQPKITIDESLLHVTESKRKDLVVEIPRVIRNGIQHLIQDQIREWTFAARIHLADIQDYFVDCYQSRKSRSEGWLCLRASDSIIKFDRSIGDELVAYAISWMRKQGIHTISGDVDASEFEPYRAFGFKIKSTFFEMRYDLEYH